MGNKVGNKAGNKVGDRLWTSQDMTETVSEKGAISLMLACKVYKLHTGSKLNNFVTKIWFYSIKHVPSFDTENSKKCFGLELQKDVHSVTWISVFLWLYDKILSHTARGHGCQGIPPLQLDPWLYFVVSGTSCMQWASLWRWLANIQETQLDTNFRSTKDLDNIPLLAAPQLASVPESIISMLRFKKLPVPLS